MKKEALKRRRIHEDGLQLRAETSRFEPKLHDLLIFQSGTGHAREGHCGFKHKTHPQMTIEDYADIFIETTPEFTTVKDFEDLRVQRQKYIDEIRTWGNVTLKYIKQKHDQGNFEDILNKVRYFSIDDSPLCGLPHLKFQPVYDHISVLQGIYIGAHLDNENSRKLLNERKKRVFQNFLKYSHPHSLQGLVDRIRIVSKPLRRGLSKAIHMDRLNAANLAFEKLSNYKPSTKLTLRKLSNYKPSSINEFLSNMGFVDSNGDVLKISFSDALVDSEIASHSSTDYQNKNIISGYIELSKGIGVSDDAAYIASALMFGNNASRAKDVSLGFLESDFNDTMDVCSTAITTEGQDEEIGMNINHKYKRITGYDLVNQDKTLAWMYMATKLSKAFPSSSQRYFWRTSNNGVAFGVSAMELYNEFIERTLNGELDDFHPKNIPLDFDKVPLTTFFNGFIKRWNEVREECQETGIFSIKYFPDYFSKYKK